MADISRILIVGGGIAGLSLATALHQQDYVPELIERSAMWPAVGAGINLPANGVRVLRALGLEEAVTKSAAVLRRWGYLDQTGALLCETDLEDLWRDVGPCLGVTRVRLQEALLTGSAPIRRRLGVALTDLAQDDGRVHVGFSDDTHGDYDLVVGADGIYSTVRRLAVSAASPEYAGQMVWRSTIPTRPPGMVDGMVTLMGDRHVFGVVPMGGGSTYGFGTAHGPRFEDPVLGRLERFRQRYAAFGGPVPPFLSTLRRDDQIHFGPVEWVDLDDWYRGRVVLIGDAAHAGPPTMGEGGCMAMEDALVLAEVLRSEQRVEDALEAYVRRRRPRADWVQEQSRAAGRASGGIPPAVRDAALRERGDQEFRERYRPRIPPP